MPQRAELMSCNGMACVWICFREIVVHGFDKAVSHFGREIDWLMRHS